MEGCARSEDELFSSCLLNLTWESCYEQVKVVLGCHGYLPEVVLSTISYYLPVLSLNANDVTFENYLKVLHGS